MKESRSFWTVGHWPTLLSSFLYFDVSFMVWVLLGAVGNYIATDFQLSPAQKGLMTAIPLLGGSILRLLFGHLTDTIGPRKTGCIGLVLTFAPLLAGWLWADSISKVYLVGLLLGVAGASFAVALPMASRWYPAKYQGLVMGIAGAGNSGTLIATLFAPRLARAYGWHAVFGLSLIPLAVVAIVFFLFARQAPTTKEERKGSQFLGVLKEADTYLFSLFYGVTFGGFVGLASFLALFLRDQYGVSPVQAGDLTSLCVLAGSFVRPVGGWLADKVGGVRLLSLLFGAVVLLILGVAQLPPLRLLVPLLFVLMACLGLGNGSVFQLVPHRYGKRVGVATGILGAAGGLAGFFLPTLLGSLKQVTGSYGAGFGVFAAAAVVALAGLGAAQTDWIGVWIKRHSTATPAPVAEAELA